MRRTSSSTEPAGAKQTPHGALALGMRVPEDLWIVGYDDIELASWGAHDLSMVRQPMQQMVGCAIDLLTARIARPAEPLQQVCLPNALVIRSPTARCVFMRT